VSNTDNNWKIPQRVIDNIMEMRGNPTESERRLLLPLQILSNVYGLKIIFQYPFQIGDGSRWIIADFYFPGPQIVIEVDGQHHREDELQKKKDWERDERLRVEWGIITTRISNKVALDDPIGVALYLIDLVLKEKGIDRVMSRLELEAEVERIIIARLGLSPLDIL
jgi:very-short-patch-repair endonuclease